MRFRSIHKSLVLLAVASSLCLSGCTSWNRLELEEIKREPSRLFHHRVRMTTPSDVLILTVSKVDYPLVRGRLKYSEVMAEEKLGRHFEMDVTAADEIEILEFDGWKSAALAVVGH